MNKKTGLEHLIDGDAHLQGLIIPEKASAIPQLIWLLIALLLVLFLFGLWKWSQFRKQPKQKALRKLALLQRGFSQQAPKIIASELANTLRQGLSVSRLSLFQSKEKQKWKAFIAELDLACYSTEKIKTSEIQRLIQQSRYWLLKS